MGYFGPGSGPQRNHRRNYGEVNQARANLSRYELDSSTDIHQREESFGNDFVSSPGNVLTNSSTNNSDSEEHSENGSVSSLEDIPTQELVPGEGFFSTNNSDSEEHFEIERVLSSESLLNQELPDDRSIFSSFIEQTQEPFHLLNENIVTEELVSNGVVSSANNFEVEEPLVSSPENAHIAGL